VTETAEIYLGLGSNMGDRLAHLEKAVDLLSQRLRMGTTSAVYETDPIGNVDQPRFLNMVCQAFTRLAPEGLLALAKGIESKLGRTGKSNAPRPIDIDILLYGAQVVDTPQLVIPHPRITERRFVLVPLAEIAPDIIHPVSGRSVRELLEEIKEEQGVFPLENA